MAAVDWSPVLHLPASGSFIGIFHLGAGLLCFLTAGAISRADGPAREAWTWRGIALLFLLFGLARQFDLQSLFTQTGRVLSLQLAVYRERRLLQTMLVAGGGLSAVTAGLAVLYLIRDAAAATRVATVVAVLLAGFAFILAVSLHSIDLLLGETTFGIRTIRLPELAAIAAVAAASVWRRMR
jgi:hypothetical protein